MHLSKTEFTQSLRIWKHKKSSKGSFQKKIPRFWRGDKKNTSEKGRMVEKKKRSS